MTKSRWFRPALTLVAIFAWLIVGGAIGGPTNGKLSEVSENDSAAFLPPEAESTLAGIERAGFSEKQELTAILVLDGVTGDADLVQAREFIDRSLGFAVAEGDERTIGDVVTGEVVLIPSQDGEAAIAVYSLDAETAFERVGESTLGVDIVETLRTEWATEDASTEAYVTGPLGIFADLLEAFAGIDGILLAVAFVVVFVILLIVYRSPVLPMFVLLTSGFALGLSALVVYVLADNDVIGLNGQSQGIMSILVVGATTDYSLLLVARYREELRRMEDPYEAMKRAMRQSIEPIMASGITVILGLLTLLFSDLGSNQSLGPVAALGIAAAMLAVTTCLPFLLLLGGKRARGVFWPSRPKYDPAEAEHVDTLAAIEKSAGFWGKVSKGVAAHPRRTWVAALIGMSALAAFLPTFQGDGIGEDDALLGDIESVAGFEVLGDHFDAGQTDPITVVADEARVDQVIAAAYSVDGVTSAYVLTPAVIQGAPGGVVPEPPVVVNGRVAIDVVADVSANSQEAKDVVLAVREAISAADPSALVGGTAATNLDTNLTANRDLTVIVPLVLLVIFVVLILLLRSVIAPLIIVLANVLSFAATIGLSAIIFNHVFKFPGSDSSIVLFGFVFLVALGVDYSIFLMSRVREEALRVGTREGVRRGLAVTGGVITSAGIVLAATFGALGVLPLLFLVQLAFIVAVGVLIDTFVVRTLLVPGLIYDIGRASWWPLQKAIKD